MAKKKKEEEEQAEAIKASLFEGKTAKKDFIISHNEHYFDIKKGDDLSHIPEVFFPNLKTEQVI